MKKAISLLLALLMAFSVATVAFAEGEDTPSQPAATDVQDEGAEPAVDVQDEGAEQAEEEKKDDVLDTIMNFPAGPAKAMLKVGKIVLKLVKVFVKLGMKFGLIDTDELVNQVAEMFGLDPETELPPGTADVIVMLL